MIKIKYDVKVELHISDSENTKVSAYGTVILNNCIKFPVQVKNYINPDTQENTTFLAFPRKMNSAGHWQDTVKCDKELYEIINEKVCKELASYIRTFFGKEDIDILQMTMYEKDKSNIKAIVSVKLFDCVTINGITIREGNNGLYLKFPQYVQNGEYKDQVWAINQVAYMFISDCVINEYKAAIQEHDRDISRTDSPKL